MIPVRACGWLCFVESAALAIAVCVACPLPCNCRTPAPRTRAACKRRPALHTCTRKRGRRGRISFLHDACVCIRSLHANGVIAACAFATGWCCRCGAYRAYRTGPGNAFCCTYAARRAQGVFATCCKMRTGRTGRVLGTPFTAAHTLRDGRVV